MTPAHSSRRSACSATVPGKQIQADCLPLLSSRSASSPGFPRGAGGGRGAGGTALPANPTQTNLVTFRSRPSRVPAAPLPGTRGPLESGGERGPGRGAGSAPGAPQAQP